MIKGSTAFIGQYIFGATDGAPLSQSATGQLASGLNSIEVSSTTNATTTSGTNALLTTMSITATPGTYIVWFSATANVNNAGSTVTFSLYNNGVQDTSTIRQIAPFDGGTLSAASATGAVSIQRTVVVTGGAVTIQWNTNGGTATCYARTLTMLRIA